MTHPFAVCWFISTCISDYILIRCSNEHQFNIFSPLPLKKMFLIKYVKPQCCAVIVLQYTGESIGQADRTELGPGVEELLAQADATKTCTDKIISQTEVLLQPSPGEIDLI